MWTIAKRLGFTFGSIEVHCGERLPNRGSPENLTILALVSDEHRAGWLCGRRGGGF
eukprot:SAG31_NODE_24612_length_478_cov_0.659631_2_plen_55_part_01